MAENPEVARLRSLAQLDADAVGAYDAALARIQEPLVRERLNDFRIDHMRHVQDLNTLISHFGGEPVELRPDLKGAAMKGLTAMTSMMGTEAALVAMLGNEEYTNRAYDLALRFDWRPEVRSLIEKHREDERRHVMWVREAVRTRPWEQARAAVHEGSEAQA
ncbi:ferritin-like domain-containing protein [Pyxidicoccus fallax]|uniref:Ferritin-like domain-containing protein n=1 Tax=Pyxidicoccus fallax TaxID=394095 RepID=A0A848LHK7_9BACT|nr:ferritin-like domain-containing protein [Pyxidicoccus fallax]NMO16068.1 ferritin-like domain-containing protein [Pyxidicoccus fallax]NPC85034.1 ferritin-like domain-containing protein [Pyxidicoccus fallax]